MDKKRLVQEYMAMMQKWSHWDPKLCRNADGSKIWWEVTVRAEGDNRLPIKIEYPPDYPASPPSIFILTPLPDGTPHRYPADNRMCWIYPGEKTRQRDMWNPSTHTAALCVAVAWQWFNAFLVWITLGRWPIRDALA